VTYQVFTSIFDCAEMWDEFLPPHHHLASVHCGVIEQCKLEDVSFCYVFISDEQNNCVAVAYFQKLHFLSKHYASPLAKNFLFQRIENAVVKRGFHILICGNFLRIDEPGVYYDPIATNAATVFSALEEFYKILHPYPHAILIKDWNQYLDIAWVEQFNFHPWSPDLTMKLDIASSWKSFEDYIMALRHGYAQRARKARKQFSTLVRKELPLDEIETFAPKLEWLYMEVVKRQTIRLMLVNKNYFVQMKKVYGDCFRIFGYFYKNELIGFSSNILYKDRWELHYIGIDYAFNEMHWLYFNMLFDAIADAIDAKKKELELGRTAREAKASLGANPVYFKNYVRVRGTIPRIIIKFLNKNFDNRAGQNWNFRKPFRD